MCTYIGMLCGMAVIRHDDRITLNGDSVYVIILYYIQLVYYVPTYVCVYIYIYILFDTNYAQLPDTSQWRFTIIMLLYSIFEI